MQAPAWSELRHAYGLAEGVPALLARARTAAPPRDYRDEPWFSLWSALCHQGDVFTASYAAVPMLVEIATERQSEPRAAAECLYLAAMIELERRAPEGRGVPPEIPTVVRPAYDAALGQGAVLAADIEPSDQTSAEMLAICIATFGGDLVRARLLADGPEIDPAD